MSNQEKFEKSLASLLSVIRNIIVAEEEFNFVLNSHDNPTNNGYNKYKALVDCTNPETRRQDFADCYNHHRNGILGGLSEYLLLEDVYVCPVNGAYLDLSSIYRTSVGVKKSVETRFVSYGHDISKVHPEVLLSTAFLLHLSRIFLLVARDSDKKPIEGQISELERLLKIVPVEKQALTGEIPKDLGPMMNMASKIMESMGVPPPENADVPSQDDIGKILGNLMSNSKIKDTFAELSKDVSEGKGFESILGKLMSTLTDPAVTGTLAGTLQPTVNAAIENAK